MVCCNECDFCEPRKLRCRKLESLPMVGDHVEARTAPAWCPLLGSARMRTAHEAVVKAAMGLHRLRVAMGNVNPDDPFDAACTVVAKLEKE